MEVLEAVALRYKSVGACSYTMQGRKRKVEEVAPFADIPDDILAVMIRHLDTVPDLLRLGQVSKRFQLAVVSSEGNCLRAMRHT